MYPLEVFFHSGVDSGQVEVGASGSSTDDPEDEGPIFMPTDQRAAAVALARVSAAKIKVVLGIRKALLVENLPFCSECDSSSSCRDSSVLINVRKMRLFPSAKLNVTFGHEVGAEIVTLPLG